MPLNKDDEESLKAHHLLHRSCRGKAHGNGIAKQSNRRATISFPATRYSKDRDSIILDETKSANRRITRNGTSSWECSDSDSLHSSGNISICTPARVHGGTSAKKKANRNQYVSPCLSKIGAKSSRRKESWADTLRVGSIDDDRIKRMEEGWDDSSVIKTPRERKWRRITAEIEQRVPSGKLAGDFRIQGLKGGSLRSWNNGPQKRNRKTTASQRKLKPIEDIIEWEEIVEMALAKKIGRGKRKRKCENGEDVVDEGVNRRRMEGEPANDTGLCMKRLEVLLQNRLPPQTGEELSVFEGMACSVCLAKQCDRCIHCTRGAWGLIHDT